MPDFFVILDGPRGEAFERILGSRRVPVLSPIATPCELEGQGVRACYMLDLRALDLDQFWSLTEHLVEKWKSSIDEVQDDLWRRGMPIMAEACTPVVRNPQRWL